MHHLHGTFSATLNSRELPTQSPMIISLGIIMSHRMMYLLLPSTNNLWFPKMWKVLSWAVRRILKKEKTLISIPSGPNFQVSPAFPSGLQATLIQTMASVASCRWGRIASPRQTSGAGDRQVSLRTVRSAKEEDTIAEMFFNYISDVVIF